MELFVLICPIDDESPCSIANLPQYVPMMRSAQPNIDVWWVRPGIAVGRNAPSSTFMPGCLCTLSSQYTDSRVCFIINAELMTKVYYMNAPALPSVKSQRRTRSITWASF